LPPATNGAKEPISPRREPNDPNDPRKPKIRCDLAAYVDGGSRGAGVISRRTWMGLAAERGTSEAGFAAGDIADPRRHTEMRNVRQSGSSTAGHRRQH
jgi:hypothetical protein